MLRQSQDAGVKAKCLFTTSPSAPLLSAALYDLLTVSCIQTKSNQVSDQPPRMELLVQNN